MEISEKEFAVIREISNNYLPDQRTIATRTGHSLGLTNLIIKRLISKGYIKAKQLNKKKIQYLLTPKGFSEKAKKSYDYTLRTIHVLKTIRENIAALVVEKNKEGVNSFVICGNNELSDIAEMVFCNMKEIKVNYVRKQHSLDQCELRFVNEKGKQESINLITYVSENSTPYA